MELLTEDEARERIRGYLRGRKWWVIPYTTEYNRMLGAEVEERYYSGRANEDFIILMGPGVDMAFARKRHMNERQYGAILSRFMKGSTAKEWADRLKDTDIINLCEEGETDWMLAQAVVLDAWIGPVYD